MIIMPGRSRQLPDSARKSDTFTGTVWADPVLPATDGVVINTVFFAPGARTFWHHHEHGQILHVLAGSGLVCSDGGPAEPLRPGDVVWVPPGERHWHGAGSGSYLVHLAISLGTTVWAEEVAGAQGAGPRPM
ncbi:Cupin domain protein [Actinacidiphila guanduensis]|uniref:Cupin domain protein n=2 Tax=Actinacidiphila guanduensis TaxID=310781 RepID=A0A1G9V0N5_9ACTN|nr:Cupin domain protein [Actinacidiphila guanduensis]